MILAGIADCQLQWHCLQYNPPENSHTRLVSKINNDNTTLTAILCYLLSELFVHEVHTKMKHKQNKKAQNGSGNGNKIYNLFSVTPRHAKCIRQSKITIKKLN